MQEERTVHFFTIGPLVVASPFSLTKTSNYLKKACCMRDISFLATLMGIPLPDSCRLNSTVCYCQDEQQKQK